MTGPFWGIDLGGTKIEGAVLPSLTQPQPIARHRIDTEAASGYEHILERIEMLIGTLCQQTGASPSAIGVGHPGVIDPRTAAIKNSNTQCLNGRQLRIDLETRLGVSVLCANDANCFALAEAMLGAGRGARTVFGVIIGTGVGGGVVINGEALHGAQGIAGEWGHNVLIPFGPPCYCGKNGCVETIVSGPALEEYYRVRSGRRASLSEIVSAADRGDEDAVRTIARLSYWFGRALGVVVNILDPDRIVLGGGLSNIDALYGGMLPELRRTIFNDRMESRIVKNELGDSAGVFGAAMLCRHFEPRPVSPE